MKQLLLPLLLLLPLFLVAQTTFTYNYASTTRSYILYTPPGLSADAPVVFVLHGYNSTANDIMTISDFNTVADANNFAVVYPQGELDNFGFTHWNAELTISTVDDVGFLSSLAQYLQGQHNLNADCTYVCGMSNGGFMSYTLACQKPDIFRGIASVTGTMSGPTWNNCNPSVPVPVFQIVGLDDTAVPVDGSTSPVGGWGGAPDAVTVNNFWKDLNMCTTTTVTTLSPNLDAVYHTDGIYGNEVWFYPIDNWGHVWPGPSTQGTTGINAADEIWDFFSGHCARQDGVFVSAKTILRGCYDAGTGLMKDDLQGVLVAAEPYSATLLPADLALLQNPGVSLGAGVLLTIGANAVVDWVLVELRDPTAPATILASRVALLQRDGDIVDVDNTSLPLFSGLPAGDYNIVVRHRNHLGVMTQSAIPSY